MVCLTVGAAGLALDLATKSAVFAWRGLPGQSPEWWLLEPYVGIQTSLNHGALFGMGQGQYRLFSVISVLFTAGILIWLVRTRERLPIALQIAVGAILAGILGNLYDRLGLWHGPQTPLALQHGVRDWILFRYGEHTWPNFNLADSYLVCSVIYLVARGFLVPDAKTAGRSSAAASSP